MVIKSRFFEHSKKIILEILNTLRIILEILNTQKKKKKLRIFGQLLKNYFGNFEYPKNYLGICEHPKNYFAIFENLKKNHILPNKNCTHCFKTVEK